ncbi:MAG TPA: energy transducer TonB [Verrucomicrobiae bacterium]|nr:energy transducer TonB [Verrucomicrobiae bacterium]
MNMSPVFKRFARQRFPQKTLWALVLATPLLLPAVSGLHGQTVATDSTRKAKVNPPPEYPALARQNGIRGVARVLVTVQPDGSVSDVKELGGHPLLLDALGKAVRKWRYERADRVSLIEVRCPFGT